MATLPWTPSIRVRIAVLVVACILPASVATGLLALSSHERERARIEQTLISASQTLSLVVERDFAAIAAALQALSTSRAIDGGDLATVYAQAKEVLAQSPGVNILLIDLPGQQLINTARPFGHALPKEKQSPLMMKVWETAKPSITDLFWGPVLKKHLVAMVVPVLRDGTVAGFLSMSLDASHLANVLEQHRLPPGWTATVLDGRNTVATRTAAPEGIVGGKGPPELQAMAAGQGVAMLGGGMPALAAFTRSSSLGWTVLVEMPEAILQAELQRSLWLNLAGASVLLVFGLLLAGQIGRGITNPILALIAPSLAIGRGDPVCLPPLPLREAQQVAEALVMAEGLLRQREAERDRARQDALTDGLTGLPNRRRFDETLATECRRQRRGRTPLALLLIDVDHFKLYNDAYGHPAGDACLRRVAKVLAAELGRSSDLPARYGGEEFAVILPETDHAGALAIAERLRAAVAALQMPHAASKSAAMVTISLGVASVPQGQDADPGTVLAAADDRLYQAKAGGRNRVVAAG